MSQHYSQHYQKLPTTLLQKCLLGTGLIFILCSTPAIAGVQTITHGKSLVVSCQQTMLALDKGLETLIDDNQNEAFLCLAFLSGVMATAQHANELAKLRYAQDPTGYGKPLRFNLYCFNWQLPYEKIARIVLNFGRKEPRYLQQPAHKLVIHALQKAYPCR